MGKTNITGIVFIVGIIVFVLGASIVYSAFVEVQTSEGMPPNPHVNEGFLESECSACHVRGITRAPIFDHPQMENCLACHTDAGADTPISELVVPHVLEGRENCIACHADGNMISVEVPHALDSTYANCASCHELTQE